MQSGRSWMIGLVAGAVLITALIYTLPKNPTAETAASGQEVMSGAGFDFPKYLMDSEKMLDKGLSASLQSLQQKDEKSLEYLNGVQAIWDSAGKPGIAAWYFEKQAQIDGKEDTYLKAAYRYFDAFKTGSDSSEAAWFSGKAIETYTKVLELNPGNLNAKTDLGALYAEATSEPMKGIMMLREVVEADSTHENAQLNLGFLSMRSGQYDKAIERFNKVLAINPSRIDMYIYRGEALVQMGKKKEAIESFKVFRNLTSDQELIRNVDQYISSLESGDATVSK